MPCGKTYTALVARAGAGRTQPDAAPRTTAVFRKGRKGMALTWVWVGMVCVALIYGAATGQSAAVGAAAAQGVQQAVTFCLTVGGMICLWSGVMEVMRRSGIAAGLSRLLQPVLRRLFPRASRDAQTLDALSMNVSANLLGLGNAATPAGVRAAQAMARELRGSKASDELCLLVVLNTASIQLLPVTIAAVREAAGSSHTSLGAGDLDDEVLADGGDFLCGGDRQ